MTRSLQSRCFLYSSLVLGLSLGWQGARASTGEEEYFSELPTVLSVSRLPQPLDEAPGAVTVIDRDFIRATGYRDIARLLRLVPGIQAGQERGAAHWVTYHGLGSTFPSEMQVLVDGRSVYSPTAFGGVDWAALPLTIDEIDRIEVVRGSNPVTYGANAFLGVINILTRHSTQDPGVRAKVNAGSPGIVDVEAGANGTLGPMGLRVEAASNKDNGFADLNDSRDVKVLTARADLNLTSADALMVRASASSSSRGEGYAQSVLHNNSLRDSKADNVSLHTQWLHTVAPGNEWQLNLYRSQEQATDRWNAVAPDGTQVPLNRDRTAVRSHIEVQQRLSCGCDSQFVWGAEARRDEVDSAFLYAGGNPDASVLMRVFSNMEWRFAPRWTTNLGAAIERYRHEPTHLAPRAFINWQASEEATWRVGATRAWQQEPTFEKYGDVRAYEPVSGSLLVHPYVSNSSVRQARIDSAELGFLGRWKAAGVTLDARLFRERIKDYIFREETLSPFSPLLENTLPSSHYVNYGGSVVLTGLEYQLKANPWRGGELRFTHTMIARHSGREDIDHRVSPYVASLSWLQKHGAGWSSTLTVLRMGPLAGSDGFAPLAAYVARPYTTVDARIAYAFSSGGRKWEASLNGINLGERHQEIADRAEQGATGGNPANRVSPMVFLSLGVEL